MAEKKKRKLTPRTLFVYKRGGIDTAEIRGKQISARLGCDAVPVGELTAEMGERYDVVIYVKHLPPKETMRQLRDGGTKQVLDVLDNYWGWTLPPNARRILTTLRVHRLDRGREDVEFLDTLIAANLTQKVYLEATYGLPSVELPHHHCNFDELRIPHRDKPVVGYIANWRHLKANARLAERAGLELVSNVKRNGSGGFPGLIETYLATDIGIAYRWEIDKMRFNCANKLTNFMSFGIPAVMTPESGHLECGRHGETVLYAYDEEDFVNFLKWLASDSRLRKRMGDACYEAAKPFHIDRIASLYADFLNALAGDDPRVLAVPA